MHYNSIIITYFLLIFFIWEINVCNSLCDIVLDLEKELANPKKYISNDFEKKLNKYYEDIKIFVNYANVAKNKLSNIYLILLFCIFTLLFSSFYYLKYSTTKAFTVLLYFSIIGILICSHMMCVNIFPIYNIVCLKEFYTKNSIKTKVKNWWFVVCGIHILSSTFILNSFAQEFTRDQSILEDTPLYTLRS